MYSKESQFLSIMIVIIVIIDIQISLAIHRNRNINYCRERYRESYNDRQSELDPFCNANYQVKAAICNEIFNIQSFRNEHDIYLNKSAFFRNQRMPCEVNEVTVGIDINNYDVRTQRMFPCYGRHNPLQSGWVQDEYFRFVFLSGDPQNNSVFVYYLKPIPDDDLYILEEIIGDFDLNDINPLAITRENMEEEMASLQNISINYHTKITETQYLRNIEHNQLFIPENSICNLSPAKKLELCKRVVQWSNMQGFELVEFMFGISPPRCDPQYLVFSHYLEEDVQFQRMFPCYSHISSEISTHITILQLSDGYYENAVFLYVEATSHNLQQIFTLHSTIHNVNIEGIPDAIIPSPP